MQYFIVNLDHRGETSIITAAMAVHKEGRSLTSIEDSVIIRDKALTPAGDKEYKVTCYQQEQDVRTEEGN